MVFACMKLFLLILSQIKNIDLPMPFKINLILICAKLSHFFCLRSANISD